MPRILCLYMTVGSGHRIAAAAVAQSIRELAPGSEVASLDLIDRTWAGMTFLINELNTLFRFASPRAYDRAWHSGSARPWVSRLARFGPVQSAFQKCLDDFQPEAVVCTHAFPCEVMVELKRFYPRLKLAAVITDFGVHYHWPVMGIERYFVPSSEAKSSLEARSVNPDWILVSGIPIHPAYAQSPPKPSLIPNLGLSLDQPIVLIVAGAVQTSPYLSSMFQTLQLADGLARLPNDTQLIIITGHNRLLKRLLESRIAKLGVPVRVLGYTADMPTLMRAATLIVSKPGGLITAEALACGLPFVIINPGPGQERVNAAYLLKHQVGVQARHWKETIHLVGELLADVDRRKRMSEEASRLGKPLAGRQVAQGVLDLAALPATQFVRQVEP
jgi:processive 1,2-diacylglycerol beta-glucosyltransferase